MKKIAFTAALALVLSACGPTQPSRPVQWEPQQFEEQEDCDYDDMIEGDEDCYGVELGGKAKKHKVSKTSKTKVRYWKSKPSSSSSWGSSSSRSSYRSSSRRR